MALLFNVLTATVRVAHQTYPVVQAGAAATTVPVAVLVSSSLLLLSSWNDTFTLIVLP